MTGDVIINSPDSSNQIVPIAFNYTGLYLRYTPINIRLEADIGSSV